MTDEAQSQIALPAGVERPEPAPAPAPPEKPEEPDWTKIEFPIDIFDSKIVIRRDDVGEMTDGGLYIPESARRGEFKTMSGTVIAVGPGIMKGDGSYVPMRVAVGDLVVFEKYRSMTPITVNGFNYHILAETDLLGKLREGGGHKVR